MEIKSVMILAGGLGTRFKEYTENIPKPMIKANGEPLLIHISNIYKRYGIENIYILGGYKVESIVEYFNQKFKLVSNKEHVYEDVDKVKFFILDTGVDTMTGGRIKKGFEQTNETFSFITYGDGIANVNMKNLYDFYISTNSTVTLTAVRPPARFGSLILDGNKVEKFNEKNQSNEGWINGGFFAVNKRVCEYIENDNMPFEQRPLERIASEGSLYAYKHSGLFRPVDTIRELELLENELLNNEFNF